MLEKFGKRQNAIRKTSNGQTTCFVYDGWNPVGEFTPNTRNWTLKSSFLFGQDLSGSMQGAGGVGGLLSTDHHGSSSVERFYPSYDGNGNVGEYVDANGTTAAYFEYDPFGQVTWDGDSTKRFPIRFSTKWQDFETGFNYYGYRYYDPQQGRWLGRDPIKERGGINLYGFVGNNSIGRIDILGLEEKQTEAEDCPCKDGKAKVKDDAGTECCEEEIGDVEFRIDNSGAGHAFLSTPFGDFGFYPDGWKHGFTDWGSGKTGPGTVMDETITGPDLKPHKYDTIVTYKACPGTMKKLEEYKSKHYGDKYGLDNIYGRNCVGWACERLGDAGLPMPPNDEGTKSPKRPYLAPSDMTGTPEKGGSSGGGSSSK